MLCRKIPIFAAALTWNLSPSLHAQFDHLSLEHGLSQTTVLCILQDSKGYLWFGTADGLNKYDGYSFTVYRNNPRNPYSLSDDWATAICEDQAGSLWIGTSKGVLNHFDRKNERFTRYNLCAPSTLLSLKAKTPVELPFIFSFFIDQTITTIFADPQGASTTWWIGTLNCGLYRLVLDSVAAASGSGDGLQTQENNNNLKIDNTIFQVTHYQHDPANPHSLSDNHIRAIHRDLSSGLWIGTLEGGLNRFDEAAGKFIHHKHDPADANSLSNNRVLAIYEDRAGVLWIGTLGGGLNKLVAAANSGRNETRAHFVHYRHDPSSPHRLSDDDVSAIIEDDYRTLWVGTFGGGLNKFDRTAGRFTPFKHDPFNPHSPGDNDVLAIGADRTGILWIGSQLGVGINKLDRRKEKFVHYKSDPPNPHSLSDDVVWSIYSPARGDGSIVWIGTYRGGLNRLDRKAGRWAYFRHDPSDPHSLCQNHIRAICEDASGALWLGTYSEGLCKLLPQAADKPEKRKVKFIHYRYDPDNPYSLGDNQIRSIHLDKSGTLWIGTFGGGLNRFDERTGRFIHYRHDPANPRSLSDDHVYTIYESRQALPSPQGMGRDETLWIGTFGGGLNRLVLDKNAGPHGNEAEFVSYKHDPADSSSLSENRVLSICEDQHGTLWIGTSGGGLNRFDRESGKFTHFTTQNGLPSNVIYGILEDERGNLWLSSNNGLSKFNPRTQACKNYDERDGLQSKEFSGGAYYRATSGEMFFGGINGLNCFFPDSLKDNFYVPPVVISAFKKFDETVAREPEAIELSHHENFFSIEFAALDYANPAKNQYAYKLEGFDQAWIYGETRRSASYTNLNPGKYIFRANGTNSDGIWNERGVALKIIIYPPFWKTWWFRFAAAGTLILLLMLAHDYRVKQKLARMMEIEQARKAENERLRKQVADDFHDEFGQKLTNIALFAELSKRNLDNASPRAMAHLSKISDTAKSLSEAMRDFIWTLDRNKDSLYNVAERLKDYGEALFAKTGIDFEITGLTDDLEHFRLSMDWKRHLVQIFKAGMQNCLRHDGCKNVTLGIATNAQSLEIYLVDDGNSFDNVDPASGPDWRYIKKRAEKIRGRLNVVTIPGSGTKIQFIDQSPEWSMDFVES